MATKKFLDKDGLSHLGEKLKTYERNIDNKIDAIDSKIDAVASGSPTPVSDISQMTDTTKAYVLVSSGDWYYYNGSAWVVGGKYQASQSLDEVEGLAFNQINENLRYLVGLGTGYINTSTYLKVNDNYRICSNDFTKLDYDVVLRAGTNLLIRIFYYDSEGNHISIVPNAPSTVNQANINDKKVFVIPRNTIFKISIDYETVPEGGRPLIDDVTTSYLFNNVSFIPYWYYKQQELKSLESETGLVYDPDNLVNYMTLKIGDFNLSQGHEPWSSEFSLGNNRRLICSDLLSFSEDIVIKKSNEWRPYIYRFDGSGTYTGGGWVNIDNNDYTIAAGTRFKIMFSMLPTTYNTPLVNIYDNPLFPKIRIVKKGADIPTFDARSYLHTAEPYKYALSICHQGYCTDRGNNNSRLSGYYMAKAHGFNVGETDVKWTSDEIPVCCHDQSFPSGGETIVIADHTYAELQGFDYYGSTIASLDSVVKACKEMGMQIAIDHLSGSWSDARYSILFGIVEKYHMQDNTWWLQGRSLSLMNKILAWYPKAKIAVTVSTTDFSAIINECNTVVTDVNEIMINFNYGPIAAASIPSTFANLDKRVKLGIWTNDNVNSTLAYQPYVDAITSNKISIVDINNQYYENYSQYFN